LFPNGVPNTLSVADVLNALGAHLDRATAGLVKADQDHSNELADDDEARRDRDERTVDMKDLLGALRSNLIRNYGSAVAGAYGFGATLPDDAPALLLLAGNVENLLRTRALVEPPKNKSLKVDAQLAADDIRDAAAALRAAVHAAAALSSLSSGGTKRNSGGRLRHRKTGGADMGDGVVEAASGSELSILERGA